MPTATHIDPLRIGLTGGIGSGKSTVAHMLVSHGAALIDADALSRATTQAGGAALPAIRALWGDALFEADGSLSRDRLRAKVFNDPAARQQLEAIIHPLVGQAAAAQEAAAKAQGTRVIVFDVPLLVESGARWRQRVDRVWVVDCAVETQIARVMARNGFTREAVEAVLAAQATRAQRWVSADAVIVNDGVTLAQLAQEVLQIWEQVALSLGQPSLTPPSSHPVQP